MSSDVMIRSMVAEDWPDVSRIYQAGMDTNLATFQTDCPSYEEWDTSHIAECRFVAELNGNVVGWAALSPVSSRCVYAGVAEVSVYIDSNAQGMGIGAALMDELSRASEQEGYWTLQSGIFDNNAASLRLHEKCGYRMVGYRDKIGKDRTGTWRNTVLMERRNDIE